MHIMECTLYNNIRLRYPLLFRSKKDRDLIVWSLDVRDDAHMCELMNGNGSYRFWNQFANFLLACKKHRAQYLGGMTDA